jgi:hypothetical protein
MDSKNRSTNSHDPPKGNFFKCTVANNEGALSLICVVCTDPDADPVDPNNPYLPKFMQPAPDCEPVSNPPEIPHP